MAPADGRTGPLGSPARQPELPPSLSPGDTLSGRYRIVRFIAQGGMGEVYEAEDLELKERIAVKTLRRPFAEDLRAMDRFRRESQLARKVTHPNVCRVFDIDHHQPEGHSDAVTFLSMEFLDGESLGDRLRRGGPMPPAEALPIAAQMVRGLAAAHKAGVVHRDFKSQNVVLVPCGDEEGGVRAVITDFGMARGGVEGAALETSLTVTGVVLGTPAYMAPEQVEGKEATPAVDVYALGVVLYEMITGSRPFGGDTPLSVAVRRLSEPPPSPRTLVPDVDPRWEGVILRCLERQPEDRFGSVMDVLRMLSGEPVAPAKRTLLARRRRWRWVAGTAFVLSVVAAGLRPWAPRIEPQPAVAVPVNLKQVTTSSGLDAFPSFSPDGAAVAYSSGRGGSFEIHVRSLAAGGRELQLTSDGQQNFQPAWSPDGTRIAYHSKGRRGIWVVPSAGGVPTRLREFGSRPAWSPDGSALAFQSDDLVDISANSFAAATLWVAPAHGGEPRQLTQVGQPPGGHGAPAWSADGKRIVFVAADLRTSGIWSVSSAGGGLFPVTGARFRTYDPVCAPDGRAVYYSAVSANQNYGMWKIRVSPQSGRPEGEPVEVANLGLTTIRHLAISPDQGRIAYSAQSMKSNLWSIGVDPRSAEAWGEPRSLTAETTRNSFPVFSPDGGRIAFIKFRPGANSDLFVADADGGNPVQLTTDPAIDYMPSWFPAGDQLAFQSNRGGRWATWSVDVGTGREAPLADLGPDADVPRLSPDGTTFLFHAKRGGAINVWLAPLRGGPSHQLTFDPEMMGFACWSPDGRQLAVEVKRGEDHQIAVVPTAGGAPTQLTTGRGQNWLHSWSPDGDKVAFAGLRDGSWNVWWVSRATRGQKRVTAYSKLDAYVRYPAWSPRGDRIVYEYAETTGNVWMIEGLAER